MGFKVTLVDCDNLTHSLTRWSKKAPIADNLKVVSDVSETNIANIIKEHGKNGGIVIVDLPGVVSRMTKNALAETDLLIVPMADSSIDAIVGVDVIKLVRLEEKRLNKDIKHMVALTQTSHTPSREERRLRKSLNANNVGIIDPTISRRVAFKALFFHGGTLHDKVEGKKSMADENGLEAAKANAKAFANAVLGLVQNGNNDER